jgi:hypothetical protein
LRYEWPGWRRGDPPIRTDWNLRHDDLNTDTILKTLRDPIHPSVMPEKGKILHVAVSVAQLNMLVPDIGFLGTMVGGLGRSRRMDTAACAAYS